MRKFVIDVAARGVGYCALTTATVWLAAGPAVEMIATTGHRESLPGDAVHRMCLWDGLSYREIATSGYTYEPDRASNVAFFPAYPLLARLVAAGTGLRMESALLVVSQVSLAVACVVGLAYVRRRFLEAPREMPDWVVLALTLYPMGLFFRMAYSESLFLLVSIGALYGMRARWPALVVASLVGLATAVRPVGVALLPALAWWLWLDTGNWRRFLLRAAAYAPIAISGLAAYMSYLEWRFDDPWAFAHAQVDYHVRKGSPLGDELAAIVTLEPIWGSYCPANAAYWARHESHNCWWLSVRFANPIYFVSAAALVAIGAWRRWLTDLETIAAIGLLGIPYALQSYSNYMMSAGRHTAAIWPLYLVLGSLLQRLPAPVAAVALAGSACWLAWYAALFAAGYPVF